MSWSFDGSSGYIGAITALPGRIGTCTAICFRQDGIEEEYEEGTVLTIVSYWFDAENYTKLFVRVESGKTYLYLAENIGGSYQECGGVVMETGFWYRIVFLHDDNESRWELYVDGVFAALMASDGAEDQTYMIFGNDTLFGTEILKGYIDHVLVYASKQQDLYINYGYQRWPAYIDENNPLFQYEPGQSFDISYIALDWSKNQNLTQVGSIGLGPDPEFLGWNSALIQTVAKPSSRSVAVDPASSKFQAPSPSLTAGASTLSLTPASARFVAPPLTNFTATTIATIDPAAFRAVAVSPSLQIGTTTLSMTPATARLQTANPSADSAASIDLDAAMARILGAAPAVSPGLVSLSLSPAQAGLDAATPTLISGSTTLTLAPAVISAAAQGFDIDSGAQSLSMQPAAIRAAAPVLDITPGTILLFMQAARAKLLAPDHALSQGLSLDVAIARIEAVEPAILAPATLMLEPATGLLLGAAPALVGATNEVLALLPAVATFVVPFPGQRTNMFLPPVQIRILATKPRLIGVATLKDRITCALLDAAREGEFYVVERNPNTGCTSTGLSVKADSIEALTNEIFADFDTARRHRRTFMDERQTWTWQLILGFNTEVNISKFEDGLTRKPRVIPRDLVLGFPQVTLRLRETLYDHPVQQEGSQGTRAVLTFRADVAPV